MVETFGTFLATIFLIRDNVFKKKTFYFTGNTGSPGTQGLTGSQGPPGPPGNSVPNGGGTVYVRWGKTTCPVNAILVYQGNNEHVKMSSFFVKFSMRTKDIESLLN